MTDLLWRLFVLLLPGVLATLFIRYITTNKEYSPFYFIVYAAAIGISNLLFIEFIYSICNIIWAIFDSSIKLCFGLNLKIWDAIFKPQNSNFNTFEIVLTYIVTIPFAFLIGYLIKKKSLINFLKKRNFTSRIGDDDIFNFYLNSQETYWVLVRDNGTKLTYYGKVRAYSEPAESREILLEDVIVYDTDTFIELYRMDAIYLELPSNNFSIESPFTNNLNKEENEFGQTETK